MKTEVDFSYVVNTVFSVVENNVLQYHLSLPVSVYEMDFNLSLSAKKRIEGHSLAGCTMHITLESTERC